MANAFVLSFNVAGEQQILSALSRFGEFASDLREPFGEIATDFHKVEGEKFASSGPGWAPLSPSYAAWKAKHYPGRGILVRTGALQSSMTGGSGAVQLVGEMTLELVTTIPYAIFHQKGTGRMPRRKIIDIDSATKIRWIKIIQRYLVAKSREVGL